MPGGARWRQVAPGGARWYQVVPDGNRYIPILALRLFLSDLCLSILMLIKSHCVPFWYRKVLVGADFYFCAISFRNKMQIYRLRVTHVMSAGLGKANEEDGIREVANLVRDAIKMSKKAEEVEAILMAKKGMRNVTVADTGRRGDLFINLKMISWRRVLDLSMEVHRESKFRQFDDLICFQIEVLTRADNSLRRQSLVLVAAMFQDKDQVFADFFANHHSTF